MTIEYVSVTEAAKTAGISRKTVLRRIRDGMLPAEKNGTEWRIDVADLKNFVEKQTTDEATDKKTSHSLYETYRCYMADIYGRGPWLPDTVRPRDRWRAWSGAA